MVSLTKKIDRLYIVVALLSAICLTTITMCLYNYFMSGQQDTREQKQCSPQTIYQPIYVTERQNTGTTQHQIRDMKVLTDPLYPAYNRTEFDTHNNVVDAIERKQLYNHTRENNDRFRLVAYLSSTTETMDAGGNNWKLMARQKDKNQGEFFMVPVDKNYDLKIMLNNDVVVGEKLRDVYTIPNQLTFKSPLLHTTPYSVVELPMTDFTSAYL